MWSIKCNKKILKEYDLSTFQAELKLKMRDIFLPRETFCPTLGYFSCGSDSPSAFRIAFLSSLAEVAEEVSCTSCSLDYQFFEDLDWSSHKNNL